jgi:phosphatidylserine decarboxylase
MASFKNSLLYLLIWLVPKNILSRLVGFLVSLKLPLVLAALVNKLFVKKFKLDMNEAEKPLDEYRCLQDLFTRRLRAGSRVIDNSPHVITSPCDGKISEAGKISDGRLLQIKGRFYKLNDLLGSLEHAQRFMGGDFVTIYLSPRDYHRFHIPMDGVIKETAYIPGTLWPVNDWAVKNIKNLFCQNERVISYVESKSCAKRLAHVAVGAFNVGKIKLSYCSLESNLNKEPAALNSDREVKKGEDLGVFMFGSTIIMLFEPGLIDHLTVSSCEHVRVGQALALMR